MSPEEEELASLVLAYLRESPEGCDSITGIANFWIPRMLLRVNLRRLERTLDHLVAAGKLDRDGSGVLARYRLKRSEAVKHEERTV